MPRAALWEPQGICGTCNSSALTPFGHSPVLPVLSMGPGRFLIVSEGSEERGPHIGTVYLSEHFQPRDRL